MVILVIVERPATDADAHLRRSRIARNHLVFNDVIIERSGWIEESIDGFGFTGRQCAGIGLGVHQILTCS